LKGLLHAAGVGNAQYEADFGSGGPLSETLGHPQFLGHFQYSASNHTQTSFLLFVQKLIKGAFRTQQIFVAVPLLISAAGSRHEFIWKNPAHPATLFLSHRLFLCPQNWF
jgi:hypothetical protein